MSSTPLSDERWQQEWEQKRRDPRADPAHGMYALCCTFEENLNAERQRAEKAEAELAAHHKGSFCPHCNPCRRAPEIAELEEALRSLASWLGVGGFNSPTVSAETYEAKIRDGVDMLLAAVKEDAARYPVELFDGNAVFRHLTGHAKKRTGPENVSDVLDALKRAIDAARKL